MQNEQNNYSNKQKIIEKKKKLTKSHRITRKKLE